MVDFGIECVKLPLLILGPCWGTKVRLLSFNRIQSRVVTGHNTLRRHLHLLGLMASPLCRKCGWMMNPLCTFSVGEALASFRHAYLGCFFLEPENINNISMGAIWNFSKVAGLP
jgi:hypothetical protein